MNDTTSSTPVKPRRLKSGDTIGIVAPASPFEQGDFDAGCALLQELGFNLRMFDGLFARQGYLCGSDQQRADQLHQAFADDDIHAVLCARGGYGVLRILDVLDFDLIGSHPKVLVGFSDITALHQALFQRCGWVSFHGPMLTTLAPADDTSLDAWRAALMGGEAVTLSSAATNPNLFPGIARGVVQGGNLATLCHLVGTTFHPRFEGTILVLEETREPLYRIDRMLTQMKLAGCFQGLQGVVLGDFSECGPAADIRQLMHDVFKDFHIPVAAGFAFGHTSPNLTLPLGLAARLDADAGELAFAESATIGGAV